jgi:hypothetical protein
VDLSVDVAADDDEREHVADVEADQHERVERPDAAGERDSSRRRAR